MGADGLGRDDAVAVAGWRMAGSTSCVTHRLNVFASGLVLPRISAYRPDGLVDDGHRLHVAAAHSALGRTLGVNCENSIFVRAAALALGGVVAVAEDRAYVLGDPPRFAVTVDDADLLVAKQELLDVAHWPPFSLAALRCQTQTMPHTMWRCNMWRGRVLMPHTGSRPIW